MNNHLRNIQFIFIFIFVFQNCTSLKLISDYDDITDNAVMSMQEKVSRYFIKLNREIGTPKANYENYINFFDEAKVDLNNLKIRTDAIEKNDITQKIVKELSNMIETTEKLHQLGFNSNLEIIPIQNNFNIAFTSIVKLQMALKRGVKNK